MDVGFVVAVVLIAGLVVLASSFARKRSFSHNQRVVLSGVAVGMLILAFAPRDLDGLVQEPGKILVMVLGIVVLVAAVRYLGRHE